MAFTAMPKVRAIKLIALLLPMLLSIRLIAGQSTPEATNTHATQEKAKSAGPSGNAGGYVGSEVCITCHEDQNRRFKNTPMGRAMANPHTSLPT